MKFNIDIECTPKEARQFLGLPDVEPMQQQMMLLIADRVRKNVERMDPENLMRNWIPGAMKNWQEFLGGFAQAAGTGSASSSAGKKKRSTRKTKSD